MKTKKKKTIHEWLGPSFIEYLVIPRSVLQSMPKEWQYQFVEYLKELDRAIDWQPKKGKYWATLKDANGRFMPDDFCHYENGRRRIPLKNKKIEE